MVTQARIPIISFIAYSGTGKTTLLTQLVTLLKEKGLRVGIVKHTHHGFDIDKKGKDSYRLREAGADQVMLASRQRWVLMAETDKTEEAHLDGVLPHLDQANLDLILVEGFKHESLPKIEVHRPSLRNPPLFLQDREIIAIATDESLTVKTDLPILDLNQPEQIVQWLLQYLSISVE